MTRFIIYLFLSSLLAASCGRHGDTVTVPALLEAERLLSPEADRAVNALDLLDIADSAQFLLSRVDTNAMTNPSDKALYALLRTQALLMGGGMNVDTIGILHAADHYSSTSPGSRRHVHALTYAGAAAESNGDIQSALYKYKMAELWCDTSWHYDIGYVDKRIANIYHVYTINHPTTIDYYQKAVAHFSQAGEGIYWLYCLTDLGAIYRMTTHQDSALYYLTLSHNAALERRDSFMITSTEVYLAGHFYHIKDYRQSIEYAKSIGKRPGAFDEYHLVPLFAAMSCAKLHQPDSAIMFLKMARLENDVDSAGYFEAMSYIASERGDSIRARLYMADCDRINDNHIIRQGKKVVANAELPASLDFERIDKARLLSHQHHRHVVIGIVALLVIATLVLIYYRKSQLKVLSLEQQLSTLSAEIDIANNRLSDMKFKLEQQYVGEEDTNASSSRKEFERLCALFKAHTDLLMSTLKDSMVKRGDKSIHNNLLDYTLNSNFRVNDSFWNSLSSIVDILFPHAIDAARQLMPGIKEKDVKLFMLMCIKFPEYLLCSFMGMSNTQSVRNKMRLIKEAICPSQSFDKWLAQYDTINRPTRSDA